MSAHPHVADRAGTLRSEFDRAFSAPERGIAAAVDDLLCIRIGTAPYALRLAEVAGLFADKPVTPIPSPVPALMGIAGFRGVVIPVYRLHLLLGHAGDGPLRWLVLAAGPTPVGLAFQLFDGHLRVARDTIAAEGVTSERQHVREVVRVADLVRPIISLPSILDVIRERVADGDLRKER